MNAVCPDWRGKTVVCIASGPSLTPEDCEAVRASGLTTVVTNTTWELCPWAHAMVAFDQKFWEHRRADGRLSHEVIFAGFAGRKFAYTPAVRRLGVEALQYAPWFKGNGNSGSVAIWIALHARAARIILLGFDCQKTGGRAHWHPDHPDALTNCASMPRWPGIFQSVAGEANRLHVPVINCTRETALTCFPRGDLHKELSR